MAGRILIVDAVATNRILMKVKLAEACHTVAQAADARGALSLARSLRPDVILLDEWLPDAPGTTLCRALRADPATRAIPVLITVEPDDPAALQRGLAAGADAVLAKPVDGLLLHARLRNLLRVGAESEFALREDDGGGGDADNLPALVALLSHRPDEAPRWRAALGPLTPHRLAVLSRAEALADDTGPVPEVFVIGADPADPGAALRLLAELRSRPASRHAALCLGLPPSAAGIAATAFDLGADDVLTLPLDASDLALRLAPMLRRKRRADRLRASVRDGMRASVRDPLTGLFNRRYALPQLMRLTDRAAASGQPFAVLALDLDRFKAVNDRWGHAAGDAVLVEVAQRLADGLRPSDLLARIGGEEFLVLLPSTPLERARALAERLCRRVDEAPVLLPQGAGRVPVTISIGLAQGGGGTGAPSGPQTGEAGAARLLARADRALFAAKAAGRNKVTVEVDDAA